MAKKPKTNDGTKDYFRDILAELKDEFTSIADDGLSSAAFTGYVDTGSYMLNALVSGSINGGIPNNKVAVFAGETTTGKTFFVLGVAKAFLDANPDARILYYDTEAAVTREMMKERGLDTKRIIVSEPATIESFRTHCAKFLAEYEKIPKDDRPPFMVILDSLGALSSESEITNTLGGEANKADVGRQAKLIKGTFRVLRLQLAKLQVPMLVTNHVYASIGSYIQTKEQAGGSGAKYMSDLILELSKKKDRDADKEVVGSIITAKNWKNRNAKQDSKAEVKLSFETGLDRYYGLLDLGEKYGVFKKVSTKYEMPDGSKEYAKDIYAEPEKYFTLEVLEKLDECAKKEYRYGSNLQ